MSDQTSIAADAELDCTGMLCPLPVYETARKIAGLRVGQVLRVKCTDLGSIEDFRAFARQRGHSLLSADQRDGVQVFHIRKESER